MIPFAPFTRKEGRLYSNLPRIIGNPCIFGQKNRWIIGHFAFLDCVFKHIAGSTFIFNISKASWVLPKILTL